MRSHPKRRVKPRRETSGPVLRTSDVGLRTILETPEPAPPAAKLRQILPSSGYFPDILLLLCLGLILGIGFLPFLAAHSFGPEYAMFYTLSRESPQFALSQYVDFAGNWYRPTQFMMPYWILSRFLNWHDIAAWRSAELLTVWAAGALIYSMVLQLLAGRRMAAFLGALYFMSTPTIMPPAYEISAFDFLHVCFTIPCFIGFYAGYGATGRRSAQLTALAVLAYAVALTCKEVALVAPAFLAWASLVLIWFDRRHPDGWRRRLLRELARLAPFAAVALLYWLLHVRRIPAAAFSNTDQYRLVANWQRIVENLANYPMWMARIYGHTLGFNAGVGFDTPRNDLVGIALLVVMIAAWVWLWRADSRYRRFALLAVGWIAIFAAVPVYSGGYLWHANLALCGYALLLGCALDWVLGRVRPAAIRAIAVLALVAGSIVLTSSDAVACIERSAHTPAYRFSTSVLTNPPRPPGRVGHKALVFVEDRRQNGAWAFGAGSLFNLVYLDRDLRQDLVPAMREVKPRDMERWLEHPNAYFFRYEDDYTWRDATAEFRQLAETTVKELSSPPELIGMAPRETRAGRGFNLQPDKTSAIAMLGKRFHPGASVFMGGRKIPAMFANSGALTAIMPDDLFEQPGKVPFQVENPDGRRSNVADFLVRR